MEITVSGLNIYYEEYGNGPETVVILEGWGTNTAVYKSVADILSGKYRVIIPDLPGFGKSEEPHEGWNVDRYTDFFIELMEKLEIREAALFGHSFGGRIIIKLVNREKLPFTVKNLVLCDAAGIMSKKSFKKKVKVLKYKALKKLFSTKLMLALFPDIIEDWKKNQGSEDYRKASPVMRNCLVMAVNEDLTEFLPNIKQDTLLIWGDKDTATPVEHGKIMEQKIAGSGLCVIPGAGHYSFLDDPAMFAAIMRSYFKI